jgi:PPOX class probable F420-dependent enzyme
MDIDQALTYARERHWGVLVTVKSEGRPQLSNVGYAVFEDGVIRVSVTTSRAKTANARRDPRVSLHVTAADFWSYVVIEGDAELSAVASAPDDATVDELVAYYRAVSGEHPNWDEFRAAQVSDGRLVLRITPTHAYGAIPSS